MQVKPLAILMGLALLVGNNGFAESTPSKGKEGDIGRYLLFQGTYTSIDIKRQQTSTHAGVFLIDTTTGQVKRYLNKIDAEGKYIETWVSTETEKP
ncbi:MAG: hypothetical protein C0407_10280 [Desulfobacca sp.]|nr:hypothetical protein [Desulfobacca sp.]